MGVGQALRLAPQSTHVCSRCLLRILKQGHQGVAARRRFAFKPFQAEKTSEHWELARPTKLPARSERSDEVAHICSRRSDNILDLLEQRGFINQIVGERDDLNRLVEDVKVGVYVGVDPTAPSLHVGHLVPLMALYWMYSYGFPAFTVLGGATVKIGDPAGRTIARAAQSHAEQTSNADKIHQQLEKLWIGTEKELTRYGLPMDLPNRRRELVNNRSWLENLPMMEIMRLLLPGVRLGTMLGRDTVRTRMKKDGMSLAEFLYPVIQAWDFWHLYSTKGVQIQVGGSDQFGNILAGIDAINFIKRNHHDPAVTQEHRTKDSQQVWQHKAMGFTIPLLTTATGEKFGKSAGNAIWLDPDRTSPFDLYQFFLSTADDDVHRYLRLFTFESLESLDQLMKSHDNFRSKRLAQHALAMNVLRLVHGDAIAEKARRDHSRLFRPRSGHISVPNQRIDQEQISQATKQASKDKEDQASPDSPSADITLPQSLVFGRPMANVLFHAGLVSSRSEGRRLCDANGAYIGAKTGLDGDGELQWHPVNDVNRGDAGACALDGNLLILRAGKTKVKVVAITSDEDFEARGLTAPGWQASRSQEDRPS